MEPSTCSWVTAIIQALILLIMATLWYKLPLRAQDGGELLRYTCDGVKNENLLWFSKVELTELLSRYDRQSTLKPLTRLREM